MALIMNFGANPFGMTNERLEAERLAEERARRVGLLSGVDSMPDLDPSLRTNTGPYITSQAIINSPTGRFTTGPDGRRVPDMRTRTSTHGAPLPRNVVNRLMNNAPNTYNESVAGGGGAMGRNAFNSMPTTEPMANNANGISGADLVALAKNAQTNPIMTNEQMATMPTHTMPDGTVHPGATHEDYMAMQEQSGMTRGLKGYNQIDPIMKQDADTDRKRDRTSFGEMLMARMNQADPGMLTPAEKMIRTGSAIVGASGQGGLAAMEAAGQSYGAIQDYERAQRQQQIDNYLNSLTSSGQLTGQQQLDLQREVTAMETQLGIMDNSLAALRSDSDLTGPFAGNILRFWDRASNSDKSAFREKIRLGLEKLRVDGILENTKNTKGAISDKEMALFMAPTPSLSAQEGVWIAWIEERQRVLRDVIYRMQNNIRIDPGSEVGNPIVISSGATSAPTTNTMQNNNVSTDIEAEFNAI